MKTFNSIPNDLSRISKITSGDELIQLNRDYNELIESGQVNREQIIKVRDVIEAVHTRFISLFY